MTAGVLTAGLISFRRGNSQLGQVLMRARVVVQGATVALMVGTAYYYGDTPWKSKQIQDKAFVAYQAKHNYKWRFQPMQDHGLCQQYPILLVAISILANLQSLYYYMLDCFGKLNK